MEAKPHPASEAKIFHLHCRSEKETLHWKVMLESVAFNNSGGMLSELQLTRDDIPVIVEQCVNFVFRHGCMTEGIYRWVQSIEL